MFEFSEQSALPKTDKKLFLFTENLCSSPDELGPRENKNNLLRVANYFFGTSKLKHPFLKDVIEECMRRVKQITDEKQEKLSHQDILWMCGPDVITTVYHDKKDEYDDICLYSEGYIKHLRYGSWR